MENIKIILEVNINITEKGIAELNKNNTSIESFKNNAGNGLLEALKDELSGEEDYFTAELEIK